MQSFSQELATQFDAIDSTVTEVDFSKVAFDKKDGDFVAAGVGTLSDRAVGNLSRWLSVPKSLLGEMTVPSLNQVIQEQMIRRGFSRLRVGRNPADNNEVIFLQPSAEPYIKYTELLSPIVKDIIDVKGNPLTDDNIRVLTKYADINPQGENLIVGNQINVSATNMKKPLSSFMTFRVVCENGLISAQHSMAYEFTTKGATANFLSSMIQARAKDCNDYAKFMDGFVQASVAKHINTPLENVMDDVEESKFVPRKVVKESRVVGGQIKDGKADLSKFGITQLLSLWDYTNLMTYVCHCLSSFSARESAERGAFSWANLKLNSVI